MLQINHPIFIGSPGEVAKIYSALIHESINITEVTTSKATVNVFIEESQFKRAVEAKNNVLET